MRAAARTRAVRRAAKIALVLLGGSALLFVAVCGDYTALGAWRARAAANAVPIPEGALTDEREGRAANWPSRAHGTLRATYPAERIAYDLATEMVALLRAEGYEVEPLGWATGMNPDGKPDHWWSLRASHGSRSLLCEATPPEFSLQVARPPPGDLTLLACYVYL